MDDISDDGRSCPFGRSGNYTGRVGLTSELYLLVWMRGY